ncbi:MAG: DUF484 family protein [Nitrospinae bacterium]|nr:DUF484 family protein [Nitrospinota bacterium]
MNKRNLVLASKISNTTLRRDVMVLRNNLKQLITTSKRNAEIQQKIDEMGDLVLQCGDLENLVARVSSAIKEWFGISSATFCLSDDFRQLMPAVAPQHIPSLTADRLFFLPSEKLGEIFSMHSGPVLRGRLEHGSVHFFGIRELKRIRSEALIPLVYDGAYVGTLNLGSNDPVRYQEGAATDYLRRLAQILALALVNLRLRHLVPEGISAPTLEALPALPSDGNLEKTTGIGRG